MRGIVRDGASNERHRAGAERGGKTDLKGSRLPPKLDRGDDAVEKEAAGGAAGRPIPAAPLLLEPPRPLMPVGPVGPTPRVKVAGVVRSCKPEPYFHVKNTRTENRSGEYEGNPQKLLFPRGGDVVRTTAGAAGRGAPSPTPPPMPLIPLPMPLPMPILGPPRAPIALPIAAAKGGAYAGC